MPLFSEIAEFISATVGNQRHNKPEDVRQVKSALNNLGYFGFTKQPEPHGYITQEMDRSIKGYQKDKGLRVDGWLKPGGETEAALLKDLRKYISDDILKEELPPHNIPGTNIPDEGIPEGYMPLETLTDKDRSRYDVDLEFEKIPPIIDQDILLQYNRRLQFPKNIRR